MRARVSARPTCSLTLSVLFWPLVVHEQEGVSTARVMASSDSAFGVNLVARCNLVWRAVRHTRIAISTDAIRTDFSIRAEKQVVSRRVLRESLRVDTRSRQVDTIAPEPT